MTPIDLLLFLGFVALGTYIQTVTGFALGLIVMGASALLQLVSIELAAIVISIMALFNNVLSLYRFHHHIQWQLVVPCSIALLPLVGVGLWLLELLSTHSLDLMQTVLGMTIVIGAILLMLKPHPRPTISPAWHSLIVGAAGGVLGGLFSTAGPPMVFHLYRQPISINAVRSSLFMVFTVGTIARLAFTGGSGQIDRAALELGLTSVPVVILFTLVGRKMPLPLSDTAMRRLAFALLIILGGLLLA